MGGGWGGKNNRRAIAFKGGMSFVSRKEMAKKPVCKDLEDSEEEGNELWEVAPVRVMIRDVLYVSLCSSKVGFSPLSPLFFPSRTLLSSLIFFFFFFFFLFLSIPGSLFFDIKRAIFS